VSQLYELVTNTSILKIELHRPCLQAKKVATELFSSLDLMSMEPSKDPSPCSDTIIG